MSERHQFSTELVRSKQRSHRLPRYLYLFLTALCVETSTVAFAADPLQLGDTPAGCGRAGFVREHSIGPATFDVYLTDSIGQRLVPPVANSPDSDADSRLPTKSS